MLVEKIKILSKELGFLKDLFLAHAGKRGFTYMLELMVQSFLSLANYSICPFQLGRHLI